MVTNTCSGCKLFSFTYVSYATSKLFHIHAILCFFTKSFNAKELTVAESVTVEYLFLLTPIHFLILTLYFKISIKVKKPRISMLCLKEVFICY